MIEIIKQIKVGRLKNRYFFAIFIMLILPTQSVFAEEDDATFRNENDIIYVAPDSNSQECSGSTDVKVQAGSLDAFLQALAKQESGGNPTAANPGSSARGKYQYIDTTWQSSRTKYPPANKYETADLAPEAVQDAVAYIEYAQKWNEFKGSIFKLAISHFYPAANSDESLLDQHIGPASNPTPREYGYSVVEKVNSGFGSEIPLSYSNAPDFQKYLDAATGGNTSFSGSTCNVEDGGLTEDQAKKFMINYGANRGGDSAKFTGSNWDNCNGGGSNCVTFSQFFFNKFSEEDYRGTMGDGKDVVSNMKADNIPTGSTPKLFSIFSMSSGAAEGHTGVVLGIHGDTVIVGHASCGNSGIGGGDGTLAGGGSGFIEIGKITDKTAWYAGDVPTEFAYPRGISINKIQEYINS